MHLNLLVQRVARYKDICAYWLCRNYVDRVPLTTLREIVFNIGRGCYKRQGEIDPEGFGGSDWRTIGWLFDRKHLDLPLDFDFLKVACAVGSGDLLS